MLVTASTVLDTPDNLRRFVADNLASGVDHMVVFLDAPGAAGQAEARAHLEAHPHVTLVCCDRSWWHGDRPERLNVRQRINANVALALFDGVEEVDWVVHVDGDEVVDVDPDALASVPADAPALWLAPCEAVSTMHPVGRPTAFKHLLDDDDLHLLAVLGVIDQPTNQAFFHGHVLGKSGVRPGAGLRLTLHDPVTPDGDRPPPGARYEHPGLRVLHFDAVSGEDFVRKWRAMSAAGPVALRPDRVPMVRALRRLVQMDLPDEVASRYLARIYEATTQDDVGVLEDLGLLLHVDPGAGRHRPEVLPPAAADRVSARLDELRAAGKRSYHVNHRPAPGGADGPRTGPATDRPGLLRRRRDRS